MNRLTLIIPAFLFFIFSGLVQAQNITFPIDIHDGQDVETCSGFFTDSGGDTLTPYSNDENYSVTFTSAPANGEEIYLKFDFQFFQLGAGDYLYVYDGVDDSADLLVQASGTELQGEQVWSMGEAIHFKFISSPSDTAGGWWAEIDCFELCDAFYIDVDTDSGSFDFCPDVQTVSFFASGEYHGGNPESSPENYDYQWNFEGQAKEGQSVSHNYPGPGAYPFTLSVTDPVNNCQTDTLKTVRFATVPDLSNTFPSADTVCAFEDFILNGSAEPQSWTGFPTIVDTVAFVNDENAFQSHLVFDVFPEDEQIVFQEDFNQVCVNMEHMDYGHLSFELECPNGSSVLLKDYSPGGAHLGEPVVFMGDDIPGVGYEYCFSVSPLFGTMAETSNEFHDYTDQAGDPYFNQPYMPEGTYTPVESFENLIGCPLNGQWTINVEDNIIGTSGHVMGWSLFFNDDFYPDSLIFTPQVLEGEWFDEQGNSLGETPALTSEEEEGEYEYTFRAVDDFGCEWDTVVSVIVLPLPEAEIVSELEIPVCEGDSTLLTVEPLSIGDETPWWYQWMQEGAELEGRIHDTIMAKEPSTYMVRVTDSITGCFDFFELAVTDQNCDLEIPNVFTPNNDGINDLFEIENLEHYPGSVIVIYNRHGKKVFEHNDYYGNWWDGRNQPDGTYYYVLTYERQGKRRQTQGVITIIR